jgi:NADH dehydrogenase/NADH:ubiquinone oxidoreductase subunit G
VYVESRGDRAYRVLPRRNEEVNQVWMCDEGRVTYHANNEGRVEWARTGKGEAADNVGPKLAVERVVERIRPLMGKGGIAIYLSAQCTNEEAAAALLLGREIGATRYYTGGKLPGDSDDFLIRADKNPNARGVHLVAEAFGVKLDEVKPGDIIFEKALFAFRTEGLDVLALERGELFIAIAQNEDLVTPHADVALPCASVYEQDGTLLNWYGRLQRTWPSITGSRAEAAGAAVARADAGVATMRDSDAAPGWVWAERILAGLGFTHAIRTAQMAFALLAERASELSGLTLDRIPDEGVVLASQLPAQWPKRAPRPAAKPETRGPQTTPPGTKVGDEASGGSR